MHIGEKCSKVLEKCDRNVDCNRENKRCVNGNCRCDTNFRLNANTYVCEVVVCGRDTDCQPFYNQHRKCDVNSGKCLCQSYRDNPESVTYSHNPDNGYKCEPQLRSCCDGKLKIFSKSTKMSLKFDFSGRVALVTGSSSGIGAATAILFAKSGAKVVVTGRNADKVAEVAKQCAVVSPIGVSAVLQVVADVTREQDLQHLVTQTVDTFGRLDVLVNNAGASVMSAVYDDKFIEAYKWVLNTNLNSMVFLTHICVKHLEKTKGNIVNVSSIAAKLSVSNASPYCMSKAAMDMFGKCIAVELGPKGIRVNTVNPGAVRTNIIEAQGASKEVANQVYDIFSRKYPVGRAGEGLDIAYNILYLASDESSFVTGTSLVSDGGHVAANVSMDAVALVTGSSSGIGAATAILFAKSGAKVVVTGRNADKVAEVAKQCAEVSPTGVSAVLRVVADVTQEEDLRRLVTETVDTFGRLDVLVNNAGTVSMCPIYDDQFIASYKNILEINLNSVVFLTHICVKHLEKTKGNIVNVSSISAKLTVPNSAPYCMSKAAMDMFGKCIAVELGPKGIRVNTVNPGVVRTNIFAAIGAPEEVTTQMLDIFSRKYPVGRVGEGLDIAYNILYLASDESSFVTGTSLVSDGGHVAANVSMNAFD
ncbi:unnamed protein product, partial [Medioppia subpectinata]